MRPVAFGALAVLCLAGCSSSSSGGGGGGNPGPTCDPCDTSSAQETVKPATNPYGDAYPTKALGFKARGTDAGGNFNTKPGNVIPNLKWLGYPDADSSGGLKQIQLADYYDPSMKKVKLIHISAASYWCGPCNQETDAVEAVIDQLKQMGVIFIQALIDGPVAGVPATQTDLKNWIAKHKSTFTEMLDPEQESVGTLFTQSAIPLNVYVDPRTMEILDAYEGAPQNMVDDNKTYVDWIAQNPPTKY